MANLQSILSFFTFTGSVLIGIGIGIGMLSTQCGAVSDRSAVEYVEDGLARFLEVHRADYCKICTYVCPRLFERMQSGGDLQSLYDNEVPNAIPLLKPYITPLVRNLDFIFLKKKKALI